MYKISPPWLKRTSKLKSIWFEERTWNKCVLCAIGNCISSSIHTENTKKGTVHLCSKQFPFFIIGFLWENQQKMHFTLKIWCFISFSLEWKKRKRKIAKFNNSLLLISPTYDLLPQNCCYCCKKKDDVNNKWQNISTSN